MKKLVLAVLLLVSCDKEDYCNCGKILSDDVTDYSITVRNDCTGNVKKFYLTEGDWMDAHPGDNQCFTNVDSW